MDLLSARYIVVSRVMEESFSVIMSEVNVKSKLPWRSFC